jgi:hypothetical protein
MNQNMLVGFINSNATRKDKLICIFRYVYGSYENSGIDTIKTLLDEFDPFEVEPIYSTAVLRATYRFSAEMPLEWLEFHEKVSKAVLEKDPENFQRLLQGLIPARIFSS